MTTVTILPLDPSGEHKCEDSYEDRDIGSFQNHFFPNSVSLEGSNSGIKGSDNVSRTITLDPPGEPESHNLTTVTRIVTLDPSGQQKSDDGHEAHGIGSIPEHIFHDPY